MLPGIKYLYKGQ